MGYKSRGNYRSYCVRECLNRDDYSCSLCIRYNRFKPVVDADHEKYEIKKAKDFLKGSKRSRK